MEVVYILSFLILALNVLDIWTTRRALKLGTAVESNPIARKLFGKIGFWPTAGAKMVVALLTVLYLFSWPAYWPIGLIVVLATAYVVINNFKYV